MNKAILIVICDFLVSAMLTMMTGMVPAHSGGTGVGLDESTTKLLLAELDSHRTELEKLRSQLKETIDKAGNSPQLDAELLRLTRELAANKIKRERLLAALNATPNNSGRLSEKELKKRLDEELQRRTEAEILLQDSKKDLAHTRTRLSDAQTQIRSTNRELAANRRDLTKTRDALAKTSSALVDMTRTHVAVQNKLAKAESEVERNKAEIRARDEEIRRKAAELKVNAAKLRNVQGENRTIQSRLAYTTGQLRVRERDNAGLQDKLTRVEGQLMVERLTAAEMRARSDELGKTLKTAVTQLSTVSSELNRVTRDKAVAETKLNSQRELNKTLIEAGLRKRSDVIANYGGSVVNFSYKVSEKKMLGTHTGSGNFFLPVVKFNNRNLIIGTVNQFAGDSDTALSFSKVTELLFTAQAPGADSAKLRIASPMLIISPENRAAAFDYPGKDRKALPVMKLSALKKRGLDGLYLFKCRSLGRESAMLDGRCSLSMVPGEAQMFIRNAGRANNELRAEPGDFIISREGEFVGLVTAHDSADSGRVRGVKVMLFDDETLWEKAVPVPVVKLPNAQYFDTFGKKMTEIRRTIPADSRRR